MFSIDTTRLSTSRSPAKIGSKLLNTTRSSNAIPSRQHARLYDLPKIPIYYRIDRPHLTREMRQNIQDKLHFNKTVEVQMNNRKKNDNLFLRYKKNPFIQTTTNLATHSQIQKEDHILAMPTIFYEKKRQSKHPHLVGAINELRTKNQIVKENLVAKKGQQILALSNNIISSTKKIKYSFKENNQQPKGGEKMFKQSFNIDEIAAIQEENYFLKNQKQLNLFAVAKGMPKPKINQILDSLHFNFTSLIQRSESISFPIRRDLSRFARQCSLKNIFSKKELMEFINSSDILSSFKRIRLEDIAGIASGRVTPQLLTDWIGQTKEEVEYEINNDFQDIAYKENTGNRTTNLLVSNEDTCEANDYINIKSGEEEKKYVERCQKIRQKIEDGIEERTDIVRKTINDRTTHMVLTDKIKRQIQHFLGMDVNCKERKSTILPNTNGKLSRNKAQVLKIDQVMELMKGMKNQQREINRLRKINSRM